MRINDHPAKASAARGLDRCRIYFKEAKPVVNHDFNELTVFAAVVELGGLTPVATSTGLRKSTLSRRIGQLENRVGQRLLLRHSNRLTPTEAGNLFYGYCRQMIDLAESSQRALDNLREEANGRAVLHVHNAFERGWLPTVLDAFMQRYPGVVLDLRVGPRMPAFEPENAGDLWLWLGDLKDTGLRSERIGTWDAGLYVSPEYARINGLPQHPDELHDHAWVNVLDAGCEPIQLHHRREGVHVFQPPATRMTADSLVMQADEIVRGKGVGVMPSWYAERYEIAHPGSFLACLEQWRPESLPVTLLSHYGHPAKKISALQEWLRASVPEAWLTPN
jgi:DNA-binding transcriptional LysR family regulator